MPIIRELVNKITFQIDEAAKRAAEKETHKTFEGMAKVGSAIMGGIGALAIGSFFRDAEAQYTNLRQAQALTVQSLQNVGKQSGKTMQDITRDAKEMTKGTLVTSTQFTREVANNLLAFGGAHGAIFDRAAKDAIDLGQKLGSLSGASIQLGLAMEHPEIGMMRLRRAQIIFTKEQQDAVKAMVASNQVDKARAYILGVVESHVNGLAGAAYRGADAWTRNKKASKEAKISIGEAFTPISEKLAEYVTKFTEWYTESGKGTKVMTVGFGVLAMAIGLLAGPLQMVGMYLANFPAMIATIKTAWVGMAGVMNASLLPILGTLGIIAGMLGAIGLIGHFGLPDNPNDTQPKEPVDYNQTWKTMKVAGFTPSSSATHNNQRSQNIVNNVVVHLPQGTPADHVRVIKKVVDEHLTTKVREATAAFMQPAYLL